MIRHGDTKLGLLLTAISLVGSNAVDGGTLVDPSRTTHWWGWLAISAYDLALILLASSVAAVFFGLVPRNTLPMVHSQSAVVVNRFAWPYVAQASFDELEHLDERTVRQEAVQEAVVLARIALVTFRAFGFASSGAIGASALLLVWLLLRIR